MRAKLFRLHCSERDRFGGKPLYEAVVARCRESGIAGATVFRGLEGYGDMAEMHRGGLLKHDCPIVVTAVDVEEAIARLVEAIAPMVETGMIAVSEVEMIRVRK